MEARLPHGAVVVEEGSEAVLGLHVPQPHRLVVPAGGRQPGVGADGYTERNGKYGTVRAPRTFFGRRKRNGKNGTVRVPRTLRFAAHGTVSGSCPTNSARRTRGNRDSHAVARMWCGLTGRYNHAVILYHIVRYGIMQHAVVRRITMARRQRVNPPGHILTYQKTTRGDVNVRDTGWRFFLGPTTEEWYKRARVHAFHATFSRRHSFCEHPPERRATDPIVVAVQGADESLGGQRPNLNMEEEGERERLTSAKCVGASRREITQCLPKEGPQHSIRSFTSHYFPSKCLSTPNNT